MKWKHWLSTERSYECVPWFENDVKMYGTQTTLKLSRSDREFENDVKMYGTQTQNSREF